MKKGNQSTTTVSILIVQLRFKKTHTKYPSVTLSGPHPMGVVSSKDLQNSRGLLLLFQQIIPLKELHLKLVQINLSNS